MKVLAFGDVHAPEYLPLLLSSLKRLNATEVSAVLIAGDVVKKGNYRMCAPVQDAVRRALPNVPIVAVFGNEDYPDVREKMREECQEVIWLDDDYVRLPLEKELVVVGTTGALDKPTRWQLEHVPNVRELYASRLKRIAELISQHAGKELTVLLTHYPPRCRTLVGEKEEFWEEMSSKKLSEVVRKHPVDAVVHGHLHESKIHSDFIGQTPVYNVALPAIKQVVTIEVRPIGLVGFI